MNGLLFIGYDSGTDAGDIPVMSIGRQVGNTVELINHITGDEATSLYAALTGGLEVTTMTAGQLSAQYAFNVIRDMLHKSDVTVAEYYAVFGYRSNLPENLQYGWRKDSLVSISRTSASKQWKVYFREKPIKLI